MIRTNVGGELAYLDRASSNRFSDNTWTDTRPSGQAYACALITDSSSSNTFVRDRFETAAGDAAVYVRQGSQDTAFLSCLFVLPGAGKAANTVGVAADPGLTVTTTGSKVQR